MSRTTKLNYDEIIGAVRWGGKLGVLPLAVASLMLIVTMVKGGDSDFWSRWVRLGIEIFLMAGWSFGAISLTRQFVAARFGALVGVAVSGLTGTLVDNMLAVFFSLIATDAPPVLLALLMGLAVSFVVAGVLTHSSMKK